MPLCGSVCSEQPSHVFSRAQALTPSNVHILVTNMVMAVLGVSCQVSVAVLLDNFINASLKIEGERATAAAVGSANRQGGWDPAHFKLFFHSLRTN